MTRNRIKSGLLNNLKAGLIRVVRNDSRRVGKALAFPPQMHGTPTPNPSPLERGKAAFTLAEGTSYGARSDNNRKAAFTLAEVLITLGIIGVVAAMTLPALVQKHKRMEATSKLKKFYSTMSQAVMHSEVDNGKVDYWEKTAMQFDENGELLINPEDANKFFNKYLAPYLKYTSANIIENAEELKYGQIRINLADGTVIYLNNANCTDIIYDINGDRQPNEQGYDRFVFLICPKKYNRSPNKQPFSSYIRRQINSREEALNLCRENGGTCSYLLQYDNWEFKEDYPYRL